MQEDRFIIFENEIISYVLNHFIHFHPFNFLLNSRVYKRQKNIIIYQKNRIYMKNEENRLFSQINELALVFKLLHDSCLFYYFTCLFHWDSYSTVSILICSNNIFNYLRSMMMVIICVSYCILLLYIFLYTISLEFYSLPICSFIEFSTFSFLSSLSIQHFLNLIC